MSARVGTYFSARFPNSKLTKGPHETWKNVSRAALNPQSGRGWHIWNPCFRKYYTLWRTRGNAFFYLKKFTNLVPLFPGLTVFNEVGFKAKIWLGHGPINRCLNKRKVRSGPTSDLQDLFQLRNEICYFCLAFIMIQQRTSAISEETCAFTMVA